MSKIRFVLVLIFALSFTIARGGELNKGYRGYVDFAVGDAYNLNTAQTISANNMQWYSMMSTTHGYVLKNWFMGAGVGYYHSYRDKENLYPFYVASRYAFENAKLSPNIGVRAGIMYDPYWIEKVQKYGAMSACIDVYKGFQVALRLSIFSRPSRYFTANAAIVLSYEIGK